MALLNFKYHFLPQDSNILKDIIYIISLLIGVGTMLYHQFHHNPANQSRFIKILNALDKHEVIFWGPALFIISSLMILLLIVGFFLSWGYMNGTLVHLYQLFLFAPSMWLILLFMSVPFLIYAVIKKSFLKTLLWTDLMMLPLLFTLDFYQGMVQQPYLIGCEIYSYMGLMSVIIFVGGFLFVFESWTHREELKKESKLAKY
jgi:hypothetical protein